MNAKKLLSVLLILSMISSVFAMPIGVSAETVTVEDDTFVAEKHYVDFSQYTLLGYTQNGKKYGNVYRTTQKSDTEDVRWSLVEDQTATGGKYLQLYNNPELFQGNQVFMRQCIINPTGDSRDNGDFSGKIRLETNTSYRIKLKYKVSDLADSYDVRFSAYATGGTTSIIGGYQSANLITFAADIKNTDGWVTSEYVFTTPEAFADGSKRVFALTMAAYSDTSLSQLATYTIAIDYVQLEKIEFKPQHMEVGFDSGVWAPATGQNGCYLQYSDTSNLTEWSNEEENGNSYIKLAHTNDAFTSHGRYSVMLNPTGASTWCNLTQAATNNLDHLFYYLEANVKYRIRFKYKLAFAEGVDETSLTVSMMTSKAALKSDALTPASATNGQITTADEWTDFEYIYTYDTATDAATKGLGLGFYKAGLYDKDFTLCIDNVVVDRVSEITAVNADGTTTTLYGAPAGMAENVCTESAAEVVPLSSGSIENYNGTIATVTEDEWYEDSALNTAIADNRTFNAANEVLYAKTNTVLKDTNQMAFCGFDTYNLRTTVINGTFHTSGWSTNSTVFSVTTDDAYSGSKSMKVSFDTSVTTSAYRQLYIGNNYELIPGQSYMISMWIKPTSANGDLTIIASGAGDIYGRKIDGGQKKIAARDFKIGEWQKIDIMFNLDMRKKSSITSYENYADEYFYAPLLTFVTTGSCNMYLDTIAISSLCTDTNITTVDGNTVRVTSNYNGCDTVYLAGDIYNVQYRRVYASFEADSRNFNYQSANEANVMVINKNKDFNECFDYNETTGIRTFSGIIKGLEDNTNASLNVRTCIMVRKEGATEPCEFASKPLTYGIGEGATSNAPAEYSLVWSDDFTGTTLNTNNWTINNEKSTSSNTGGDYNAYEEDGTIKSSEKILAEQMDLGLIQVENGELSLNVIKNGDSGYMSPYSIWSARTMNFRYGYIEARIQTPYIDQNRAAFWFQSGWAFKANEQKAKSANSAEINLFEILSNSTDGNYMKPNIHLWHWDDTLNQADHIQFNNQNLVGGGVSTYGYKYSPDDKEGYHIYGMKWTPTDITIYIDGIELCTYNITLDYDKIFDMENAPDAHGYNGWSTKAYQDPVCILLGSGVASGLDSYESQTTKVDWVRLYQKSESGTAYDETTVKEAIWR